MKSTLEIETGYSERVYGSVSPSLKNNARVDYTSKVEDGQINVDVDADQVGVLRGCTDSAFRLIMLADKVYSKEV